MAKKKSSKRKPRQSIPKDTESHAELAPSLATDEQEPPELAIAGVGASAGGLEAFSQLLQALPPQPGLAIIFVQHLAPQHESALPALLSGTTPLPVTQVEEGVTVEANHVYVIPPNVQMELRGGKLHLAPRPDDRSQYRPIDFFFRSLAHEVQSLAIGVVLSGTASDGSIGLREIKAVGGITLAQEPSTARHSGMPEAALQTGIVDLVLPPAEIAAELVRIARHPYVKQVVPRREADETIVTDAQMQRIFSLLRASSGVDFAHYKSPTIMRRLQRRMALHKIVLVDHYIKHLEENPLEVSKLYQDLLIHVTRFFREPDSFQALSEVVFPKMIGERNGEPAIRIWAPGCATGEEAYSVAIALLEFLSERRTSMPIQIFATDVSESAVEAARAGVYPPSISEDVSPERLRRFFSKTDGNYRISKAVRDLCVFARQDLTRDPPFSRLDLIVCRNVLIYLGPRLQKRLMSVFHYALRSSGFLMLGSAETTGAFADLWGVADKNHRIFTKKTVDLAPGASEVFERAPARAVSLPKYPVEPRAGLGVQGQANQLLLEKYAPPAVIVDSELQIIQFRGQTGKFLEPAPGDASLDVLKMAREGLLHALRTALHAAQQRSAAARKEGLRVKSNGGFREVNLEVLPLVGQGGSRHYLVTFEDVTEEAQQPAAPRKPAKKAKAGHSERDEKVRHLEQELVASRDYLQSIIQDLEASNEELQSANEEILSSNEELQSTNEELDTAREELQSSNEELNTLNDELHGRNEELGRANSDLVNLLANVQIAIVMVANDLRIRLFTPLAERVLNLISGDIGRPISQIKPNIEGADLEPLIRRVIETMTAEQREVTDAAGRPHLLVVRPYRNTDNRIDGAVLTLFDTSEILKRKTMKDALDYSEAIVNTVREPLMVLDSELRVQTVNGAFFRHFGVNAAQTEQCLIYDLGDGQWNIPQLRELLQQVQRTGQSFDDYLVEHDFPHIGQRRILLNARQIEKDSSRDAMILLAMEDVTDRSAKEHS